jgi:hypothetical protein
VEACFTLFGDSGNLDARKVRGCVECTIGSEVMLDAPDGTPSEWVMWNLLSICLETMLESMQYMCTV